LCILSGILHSPILTACEEVLELYQSKQVAKEMSQKPDSKHYYKIKVGVCGKLVHLLLVREMERVSGTKGELSQPLAT